MTARKMTTKTCDVAGCEGFGQTRTYYTSPRTGEEMLADMHDHVVYRRALQSLGLEVLVSVEPGRHSWLHVTFRKDMAGVGEIFVGGDEAASFAAVITEAAAVARDRDSATLSGQLARA